MTKDSALGSLPLWAMACINLIRHDNLSNYLENVIDNRSSYLKTAPLLRGTFLDPDSFGLSPQ